MHTHTHTHRMALLQRFEEFVFDERLGAGTYGVVFRAHSERTPEAPPVAVKCVSRDRLNKKAEENVMMECQLLQGLRHPNIVQMLRYAADPNFLYIVMEFCSEGDLSQILKQKHRLAEGEARFFLGQLASALEYLHDRQIAHLDLKPSNLLIYLRGTRQFLKLADFGFACRIGEDSFHESLRGSPLYLAPEMLCDKKYDARADLWSVGVILHEVLFGRAPFHSETYLELIKKITSKSSIKLPPQPSVSSDCRDLVLKLLQRNPDKRITFSDFFKHPFVDLDHVPSHLSLAKGRESARHGHEFERSNMLKRALDCYCDAAPHLIAAACFETDVQQEQKLFKEAEEAITKAEELKAKLRRSLGANQTFLASAPPEMGSDLVVSLVHSPELTHDLRQAFRTAFESLHKGFRYDEQHEYELAGAQYELGIERLLECVKGNYGPPPNRPLQEQLYSVIERYLARLEEIKTQARDTGRSRIAARECCIS
ncbi:ULK/ULK protein kinase [Salpingoeca rosetta]|uniref:Serine/threonine-protein kinase ULK3 n=1 Tax=Salpingoeca rosetta (strain ATCC 50818 / BSB-021) TaxID=946362 RepID=F2TWJ2_SALR5|nr:ULK/ULK protein kinase [Salpingoeca rosetta]EGD72438.1 ULK/ULK protein kinase [Salpingoeca rosetta]|eukprot:XP_004999007.1 ULK/ULK protein kinase [Salpingoeca rosetta]